MRIRVTWLPLATLLLSACSNAAQPGDAATDTVLDAVDAADVFEAGLPPDAYVAPRMPGQRAPRSAECDSADPLRCLLPWPSNVFTVADPSTATGLRVALHTTAVGTGDDPAPVNRADGFSRVTPLATGYPGRIDPASLGDVDSGALRLVVAQPGDTFGHTVPLRFNLVSNGGTTPESLVVGYPRVPLAAATDYVVVVTDRLRNMDGTPVPPDRAAQVSLGLAPPATLDELALAAYHAPTRMALSRAGIDPSHVLRVWDFTTRSQRDATHTMNTMRDASLAALTAGNVTVAIDTVTASTDPSIALVVEGRLQHLPNFRETSGTIHRDATGAPVAMGEHDAPFRIVVPQGTGDYRVVMYGHGTGGNVHDSSFDVEIASNGAAKVGIEFTGWTDRDVITTFEALSHMLLGTDHSSAGLIQSVVDGMTAQHALSGPLGDALAAPMIGGMTNPAAGRRPDVRVPVWAGGSLGGTMGLVYSNAEPTIAAGVLNVPGAAWTHFVTFSNLYALARVVLRQTYHTELDMQLAVATSQIAWDDIDGAPWVDARDASMRPLFLVQESIGDPILPNIGNEMVATSVGATQVAAVLAPVPLVPTANTVQGHSGFTQFHVPSTVTMPYDIHGFAAHDTIAGSAARQQILAFLRSVWAGAPEVDVPPLCHTNTPADSCDFTAAH